MLVVGATLTAMSDVDPSSQSTDPQGSAPSPPPPQSVDPPPTEVPSGPTVNRLSADQRQALLAQTVATQVATGKRVESQGPYNAIVVRGKPVNNVLHLILTLVTAGIWILVWIPLAIFGGEKRYQVSVDDFGNTSVQKLT